MAKASFWEHPIEKLEEALNLKRQIAALQTKLSGLFTSDDEPAPVQATAERKRGGRRKFSAESRAKMAAAQKARWAKLSEGIVGSGRKVKSSKRGGRRTMSPEARERIAAAQRARWAKSKAEAKK